MTYKEFAEKLFKKYGIEYEIIDELGNGCFKGVRNGVDMKNALKEIWEDWLKDWRECTPYHRILMIAAVIGFVLLIGFIGGIE